MYPRCVSSFISRIHNLSRLLSTEQEIQKHSASSLCGRPVVLNEACRQVFRATNHETCTHTRTHTNETEVGLQVSSRYLGVHADTRSLRKVAHPCKAKIRVPVVISAVSAHNRFPHLIVLSVWTKFITSHQAAFAFLKANLEVRNLVNCERSAPTHRSSSEVS